MSNLNQRIPKSWCFTSSAVRALSSRTCQFLLLDLSYGPYSIPEVTEMNPQIRTIAVFLALALVIPALAQAGGTVPVGAKISVVTDQSVSSKTAKIGQTV